MKRLPQGIRSEFWAQMVCYFFGGYHGWRWLRWRVLPDQWQEDYADAFGAYCAGGEL